MSHDRELLDRLAAFAPIKFDGEVFRATRRGLDRPAASLSGGRWMLPNDTPTLYTSGEQNGAIAEIVHHWSQLTPLPAKPVVVHTLGVRFAKNIAARAGRTDRSRRGLGPLRHIGDRPHSSDWCGRCAVGPFEAVACAAGDVFPAPLELTTDEQWANSIKAKGMGQINLVRAALPNIADKGSFTLISGVLTDEYTAGGVIGTVINHIVEGFVKAAAVELPRGVRINCISPTVLTESVAYHPYFPGFIPVDAREVAQAYLRAMSNPMTGRILKLHKTNS